MATATPPRVAAEVVNGLVQGERNTVVMNFNYDGAVVSPASMPAVIRQAPPPVKLVPAPFKELLDRTEPTAALMQAVGSKMPAELSGPTGVGKSALLRYLCGQIDVSGFSSGIVYLEQRGQPVDDLLQFLFTAFYDAPQNFTPVGGCLVRYLQPLQALVVIDDAKLERADIDHLRNVAAGCSFVLAGDQPQMTEGRAIPLPGLPEDSARTLLERRLNRALDTNEQEAARAIWSQVGGRPLYLIQAAGLVLQGQTTLVELAARLQAGGTATLGSDVLAACSPDERQLLATLGALGNAPVGQQQLAAITGSPSAVAALSSLSERGLVQAHSPSFTAVDNVKAALPEAQTLDMVLAWSKETSDRQQLLEAAPLLQNAMAQAAAAGRWPDVIQLARSVEGVLAANGRWAAWKSVLDDAYNAAGMAGDKAQSGWALHQLGSRELGLEHFGPARKLLTEALAARNRAGDQAGAAVTQHNLETLRLLLPDQTVLPDKPPTSGTAPAIGGLPWALIIGIPLALMLVGGGVAYAVDPGIFPWLPGSARPTPVVTPLPPLPTIVSVSPSVLGQGATSKIAITGTDFQSGMTLDPGLGLQATSVSIPSSSQLVAVLTVAPDAAPGQRSLVITTGDGRKVSCSDCLTISPAPFIQRILPNAVAQGASTRLVVETLYLTDKTQLSFSGSGITLSRVIINVPTRQLTGIISVASNAPLGARNVTVLNPDGGTSTCSGCFTVTPPPIISKANPSQVSFGPYTVQLFGSGLTQSTVVQFPNGFVTVDSSKFVNAGEIDVTITVSPRAFVGNQTLVVTNPDGGTSTCRTCFTVAPPPIISSATPSTVYIGQPKTAVKLFGSGLTQATSVQFPGGNVTVDSIKFVNPGEIDVTLTASPSPDGYQTLVVTNPDGGRSQCDSCLAVGHLIG